MKQQLEQIASDVGRTRLPFTDEPSIVLVLVLPTCVVQFASEKSL